MNQQNSHTDGRSRRDGRMRPSSQAKRCLLSALAQITSMAKAVLQEIFDETAYQRFLNRSQLQSSSHAYAMFLNENEQAKSRRPRCC